MRIRELKGEERARFLMIVQNENREIFLQLAFVLESEWSVHCVCDLTWAEIQSKEWSAELFEILQQCSTEFEPWVFRYGSAGAISQSQTKAKHRIGKYGLDNSGKGC